MKKIDSYEQYCKAYNDKDDKALIQDAELMLFIQNWIVRILDFVDEDTMDYSLKKLLDDNSGKYESKSNEDALSNIVDDTNMAFRYLIDNLREKILRENVQMPVYKVKEINSYGINWLSRQAGRTIKQKVSSAGNSIMAVQRRMSFDTAENRLFVAFAKELYEYLFVKLDNVPSKYIRPEEEEFCNELAAFLYREDIKEIKCWENLPPNNTLLSDQNYKKIWYGWNELKKLDERVMEDFNYLDNRLTTIFFVELLTQLRNVLMIPQEPVEVDYDSYSVHLCSNVILGLDSNGNEIKIWKGEKEVFVATGNVTLIAKFEKKHVIISLNGDILNEYDVFPATFSKCVQLFITEMGVDLDKNEGYIKEEQKEKYKNVIMDIFSLHPLYLADNRDIKKLQERVLQQRYRGKDIDGNERDFYISCEKTNALKIIYGITETYTIPYAVDKGSMEQMKRLMHMMEDYFSTDYFSYTFPDAYNEFQLSMVHKASRMAFRKVRNIPYSIGAVFEYQQTEEFQNGFEPGDFVLVLNLLDDELTYTLLSGEYDENVKKEISEYKGIIWERHPTSTSVCKDVIEDRVIERLKKLGCDRAKKVYKLLGVNGIQDEINQLSFYFENGKWYELKESARDVVEGFAINVTDKVTEFLARNSSIIRGRNVHIISLNNNLMYKGNFEYQHKNMENVLWGCSYLEKLQQRTTQALWHDHLPALAIKLMYGKFDLIKNAKVIPKFDKKQRINIDSTFTLPKNCTEYHFNLVQDDNAREMQYEAVIKNPAFPLKNEVECKLLMTYQYGAEEPYELIFVPLDTKNAGFVEAKVEWKRVKTYAYMNLGIPEFPEAISWDELKNYESKNGISNLLLTLKKGFDLIANGYVYFDFGTLRDNYCGNHGKIELNIDGSNCIVSWNNSSWAKGSDIPEKMGEVSFLLNKDNRESAGRSRISNLYEGHSRGDLWFKNRMGSYQCISSIEYNGYEQKIALFDSEFDDPATFDCGVYDVSFEIIENKNGKLKAVNIHDESKSRYVEKPRYFARGMRIGNKPPMDFASGWFNFALYKIFSFSNNRSLAEQECPKEVQDSFARAVNCWIDLYRGFEDENLSRRILLGMSLMARDIGKPYYQLAYDAVDLYYEGKMKLADEVGCGLGDLSREEEKELFDHMIDLLPKTKMVFILSKALWHNKNFVYNVKVEKLLEYRSAAIKQINQLKKDYKKHINNQDKIWKITNDMAICMEYILGLFRLRNLQDEVINRKYLSLNDEKMQKLYSILEEIVEIGVPIKSFLKLEISSKGSYEFMPDLVYVLLVYITGQSAEGEIKISGLNLEEED